MWRESGKQMPFKEFATLYNSGGLDAYFNSHQQVKKSKESTPIETINTANNTTTKQVACPPKKEQSNTTTYLQIAALVLIIAGTVYLATSKKD